VRSFRMAKAGTRFDSVLLTFTPEGIAIQGDLTPSTNGVVSARAHPLGWFVGNLGHDYLASKFLAKEWVAESAAEFMRELAHEPEREAAELVERETIFPEATGKRRATLLERAKRLREIAEDLDGGTMMLHELVEALNDLGIQYDSEGYTYPPNDVVILAAIQQRFAELYAQGDWAGAGLCEVETLKAHLTEERALRDVAQTEVRRLRAEVDAALVRAENAETALAEARVQPAAKTWREVGPERRASLLDGLRAEATEQRALAAGYTDQMRTALDAGWPKVARSAGTAAGEALARAEEHEAALQVLEAAGGGT